MAQVQLTERASANMRFSVCLSRNLDLESLRAHVLRNRRLQWAAVCAIPRKSRQAAAPALHIDRADRHSEGALRMNMPDLSVASLNS
jgi:hypothetical protein